jgi:hypothetical protein
MPTFQRIYRVTLRWLLASSSVVAALVAGSARAGQAASCDTAGPGYANSGAVPCIAIDKTSFSGTVTNSGSVGPGGITVTNATIDGGIVNSGTIAARGAGILVNGAAVAGGITNSGAISAGAGIVISNVATFSGGITNSGMIGPGGIAVTNSTINGAISDTGSIAGGITTNGNSAVRGELQKRQP